MAMPLSESAGTLEGQCHSLAIGVLVEHIGRRRDCCVLDLGPGIGANVEFLSQFSSRLVIEDLHQTLVSMGRPFSGEKRVYCPLYDALLPSRERPFDVILLWNLLDYLEAEDIRRLSARMAALSHSGTVVYGLVSTRQTVPDVPVTFKIIDQGNMSLQSVSSTTRACPRYGQTKLLDLMRGFRIKRSFLLRNGMQEYLFEFDGGRRS